MNNEIISELKRMIIKSEVLKKRGINKRRLRSLLNPLTFDLIIEANMITGDFLWLTRILESIKSGEGEK